LRSHAPDSKPSRLAWDGDWDDEPAKLRTDIFHCSAGNVRPGLEEQAAKNNSPGKG